MITPEQVSKIEGIAALAAKKQALKGWIENEVFPILTAKLQ